MESLQPLVMALVAGTIALATFLALGGRKTEVFAGPLALGLGYLAGQVIAAGWPTRFPVQTAEWIPFIALAALIVAVIQALVPTAVGWLLRVLLIVFVLYVLLRKQIENEHWKLLQGLDWVATLGCAALLLSAVLDQLAGCIKSLSLFPMLAVWLAASGATLILSGNLLLGLLDGALMATLVAGFFAACWHRQLSLAPGAATIVATLCLTFWISGFFYGELPALSFRMLLLCPPLILLVLLSIQNRWGPWQAAVAYTAVLIFPLALAVTAAALPTPSESEPDVPAMPAAEYDEM